MRVLCLTDYPMHPPGYQWIWHHLSEHHAEVDFLWTELRDKSAGWGKLLTRYPSSFLLASQALKRIKQKEYDLIVAWEGKVGIPMALLWRARRRPGPRFVILGFTPGEVSSLLYPLVRLGLQAVDHVSVFTRAEVGIYERIFSLPSSRISFCPYGAYDTLDVALREEHSDAHLLPAYAHASGRSARDYATLIRAVTDLGLELLINTRGYSATGLRLPANVRVSDLAPPVQRRQLVLNSLFEIVPLKQTLLPVGTSQIVFSMMMGKAVIATRTHSSVDYIEDNVTGMLVDPYDARGMRCAIVHLLEHPQETQQMGIMARRRFEECYSFPKFARRALSILDCVYASS